MLWLGGLFGLAGAVWGIFLAAEGAIPDDEQAESQQDVGDGPVRNRTHSTQRTVRQDISEWLTTPQATVAWRHTWIRIFDSLLGEKHLSWQCFRGSCVASLCAVGVLWLLWTILRPSRPHILSDQSGSMEGMLGVVFGLAILVNLLPDYLSLLETRWLIGLLRGSHSTTLTWVLRLIDVVVTGMIFYGVALLWFTVSGLFVDEELSVKAAVREALEYEVPIERLANFETFEGPPISIFFYSTFVTSFWLWLYALSGALVRSERALGGFVRWLRNHGLIDTKKKPIQALGLISALIVAVLYVAVTVLSLVF